MAWAFTGGASQVDCSTSGLGFTDLSAQAHSFGAIIRRSAVGGGFYRNLGGPHAAAGATALSTFGFNNSDFLHWETSAGSGSDSTVTLTDTVGWYVYIVTKAAGVTVARFHLLNLTTGVWSHTNGASAQGADPSGPSLLRIGGWQTGDKFDGDIDRWAMWSGALTDGQVESMGSSLLGWQQMRPVALYTFKDASVGTLRDITGRGGNETARAGSVALATRSAAIVRQRLSGKLIYIASAASGTFTADQAAATAAGINATPKATYTADQTNAAAAGLDATPRVTYTATQASATAAGLDATTQVTHRSSQFIATAAGIDATTKATYTATQASATAAGLTATVTYAGSQSIGAGLPVFAIGPVRVVHVFAKDTRSDLARGLLRSTYGRVNTRTTRQGVKDTRSTSGRVVSRSTNGRVVTRLTRIFGILVSKTTWGNTRLTRTSRTRSTTTRAFSTVSKTTRGNVRLTSVAPRTVYGTHVYGTIRIVNGRVIGKTTGTVKSNV